MNAFEEFSRSQDSLIQKKYEAIYRKRHEILEWRSTMTMVDDPESDDKVQHLKELLIDLDVLEHELSLLQSEGYSTLEKYLQLDELNIAAVFPRWQQEESKIHLKSMSSSSSVSSLSSYDSLSSLSGSTQPTSTSAAYVSTPGYSFSQNNKIKNALLQDLQLNTLDVTSFQPGVPSPLPDELSELLERIRVIRAKLHKYKQKKSLNSKETALKLHLEESLKEAEAKHVMLLKRKNT